MAKRSGLSFDSDRIGLFLHTPTVINSFPDQQEHTLFHHHHHKKLIKLEGNISSSSSSSSSSMESSYVNNRSSPPNTIQFPVNLNCTATHDEMDFFARDKKGGGSVIAATTATDDTDAPGGKQLNFKVNTGLHLLTANTSSDQSIVDDGISSNPNDKKPQSQLAMMKAELDRINAENDRLKEMLNQVTNNYNNLQMHSITLMQQKQQQQENICNEEKNDQNNNDSHGGKIVPRQFIDLGLAAATTEADEVLLPSPEGRAGREQSRSPPIINNVDAKEYSPGRMGREDSPDNKGWEPNKVSRLNPATKSVDQATEATMRKARVSVRARSEAPMITDGCQWRKYGQKMAKGNPCPRAYYRCTMAAGCPVRKQVQRCAEDRTILITTYEGNHNHILPAAAMAMASTTSSAAKMLLSGSMPSADGLINSNLLARSLFPSSSTMATISASAPFPTVTLDLTQNPNPNNFQISQNINDNNKFHLPFQNNSPQLLGQALYNQSQFSGLQMSSPHQDQASGSSSNQWTDAVNAFTADPNFPAFLAAALRSMIGGSNGAATNNAAGSMNNGSTSNGGNTSYREN